MTIEQELIDSLKTTIAVQADLIAQLKLQIGSLKASQITISAPSPTIVQPLGTYPPNQQPWVPGTGINPYPYNPFTYITSGGGTSGIVLISDPLPPGSIQSGSGGTSGCVMDYTKVMNQPHNVNTTTSNVVSMYESIIQPTPAPISTEACNGMS
jgi:hypothetical protein